MKDIVTEKQYFEEQHTMEYIIFCFIKKIRFFIESSIVGRLDFPTLKERLREKFIFIYTQLCKLLNSYTIMWITSSLSSQLIIFEASCVEGWHPPVASQLFFPTPQQQHLPVSQASHKERKVTLFARNVEILFNHKN